MSRRHAILSSLRPARLRFHTIGKDGPTVNLGLLAQATGLFAATNIDDVLVLALFFAQGAGRQGSVRAIAIGQTLGFLAMLAVAVAAAFGAGLLPERAIAYLGLLPLALFCRPS